MGRPTDLTPELSAKFLEAISRGNYRKVACQLCGISYDTLKGWGRRARVGDEPYATFFTALIAAEAQAESEMVAAVRAAAFEPKTWQAAMEYLARKFPDRWGRKDKLEVSKKTPDKMTDEELTERLERALEQRRQGAH